MGSSPQRARDKILPRFFVRAFPEEVGLTGNFAGQTGCQPAIQPIAIRRYLAEVGDFLKFVPHLRPTGPAQKYCRPPAPAPSFIPP